MIQNGKVYQWNKEVYNLHIWNLVHIKTDHSAVQPDVSQTNGERAPDFLITRVQEHIKIPKMENLVVLPVRRGQ